MTIQLSDHFTYRRLLRFTLPSIAMMIFTSIYGVVDGFFVSNFVGKTPFAAVNFIRFRNEHAEDVLAQANHKFKARFQAVERIITGQDREMKDATPEEMDQLWNQAKADGIK